jgi:hypothetical protein
MLDPTLIIKTAGLLGIFLIVFCESGLFFGFFLPGDTLLFASGIFALQGLFPISLLITSLVLALPEGDPMTRSIKIVEILFQDLIIAGVLVSLIPVLGKLKERLLLATAFAALHVPLIGIISMWQAFIISVASFLVAFIVSKWFVQSKYDMVTIIVPHLVFYLLFGNFVGQEHLSGMPTKHS